MSVTSDFLESLTVDQVRRLYNVLGALEASGEIDYMNGVSMHHCPYVVEWKAEAWARGWLREERRSLLGGAA